MPLLGGNNTQETVTECAPAASPAGNEIPKARPQLAQSKHSGIARTAIMSHVSVNATEGANGHENTHAGQGTHAARHADSKYLLSALNGTKAVPNSNGKALTDTPLTTAPTTPEIPPKRQDSGSPRIRPRAATTLDIPGLTKSKVSPDGKISQRDVGSKLVIIMVGLPARGKSYITKKLARYLNWLQHDTRIFNVGERRRDVASHQSFVNSANLTAAPESYSNDVTEDSFSHCNGLPAKERLTTPPTSPSTRILLNGGAPPLTPPFERLPPSALDFAIIESQPEVTEEGALRTGNEPDSQQQHSDADEQMDQSAQFFDPSNQRAASIREQVAMETLDELLDFILEKRGSVGIFDATNSTLARRKALITRIRDRAGPDLGVLFLESVCIDESLLEANMRLKLSGPDYKDQDPVTALKDFKERVAMYQKKYVSLGEYEEQNNMPFIQMIDVGRKIISHQIRGFLSAQTNYYLLNFNLAPRQIWITRHGESQDNVKGRIGGDSDLTAVGQEYAKALTAFIKEQRQVWDIRQQDKARSTHFPPQPGDTTPPNPAYTNSDPSEGNFCVWTSMLKRSIQTAQFFDEEEFDVKQMRMLDELNAGMMEGSTYEEIKEKFSDEYERRKQDKLHYRYPGAGGEGYLDIINRLRPVIHEVERMTDSVLLVGHRSVARVLLAYFKGLDREDVADLDVPLGVLYMLEPKPYGVEFKAYRYDSQTQQFHCEPDYELKRAKQQSAY